MSDYLIPWLAALKSTEVQEDPYEVEYRLLCSGTLTTADTAQPGWEKNSSFGLLLHEPFHLIVASYPLDSFPQEIAVRFPVFRVTQWIGMRGQTLWPDQEIAEDIATLLTVLTRRLVTVAAKVRSRLPEGKLRPEYGDDLPIGFITGLAPVHWKQYPASVITSVEGIRIEPNNPPPKRVTPEQLKRAFLSVPTLQLSSRFILAARLYRLALELIETSPYLAYLLLINSVEAIAEQAIGAPPEDEMIRSKESVRRLARELGLEDDAAKKLAIEACRGIGWSGRKFREFLVGYSDESLWGPDVDYPKPDLLLPKKEDFKKTLDEVYRGRGSSVHTGRPIPASARIGRAPDVPWEVLMQMDGSGSPFPPVIWFERLVNQALCLYLEGGGSND